MTAAETALTIGIWQESGALGDVAANLATISRATARASKHGVQFLIFPECFLTGYFNWEGVERIAHQVDRKTVSALQAIARNSETAILIGYYEVQANGIYNAALLLGADGLILAKYRKRMLYGAWEKSTFLRGTEQVLIDLCGIKIAVLICFEIEFPELARECAHNDADLIAVPTALMEPHDRIARQVVPVRAIENQLYVAYANRVGREHDQRYIGQSSIHDPKGAPLAMASNDTPELLVATVTKSTVSAARADFSYVREIEKLSQGRKV